MKRKIILFIFSTLLILTSLAAGTSWYLSQKSNREMTNKIKNNFIYQVKNKLIRFSYSLVPIERELHKLSIKAYQKLVPEIIKRFKLKKSLGVKSLKKLALKAGVHEIYLIDRNNTVLFTSFQKDLNLNFSGISSMMPPFLDKVRLQKTPIHQPIAQSMLTGRFSQYSYYYIKDIDVILELGTWVNQYLDTVYSPGYRKKLLNKLFLNDIKHNDYVKSIMISTSDKMDDEKLKMLKKLYFDKRGLRDIISLKKIPFLNFDLYYKIFKNKEVSIQTGSIKRIYSHIEIPELANTFVSKYFVLYVAYDFSIFSNRQKEVLITTILTVMLVFLMVFFVSTKYLKNNILSKIFQINSSIANISRGDYSRDLNLKGNDELSSIAKHINHMKESIQNREDELTQTKKILQTSLNQSPLSIIILEAKTQKVLYSNQLQLEFQECLGINLGYLKNQEEINQNTILYPDRSPYLLKDLPVSRAMFHSETIINREIILNHNNDSELWLLVNAAPIHDEDGVLTAVIVLCQDISEEKKAEYAMVQAQKMEMIGTLASGIAHDFNNIMSGIIGMLTMIKIKLTKLGLFDNHDFPGLWEKLNKMAHNATAIIKQLLNLSKEQKVKFEYQEMSKIIQEAVELAKTSIDKSIEIKIEQLDEGELIKGDKIQLEQVLLNLCINAGHAMTIMKKESEKKGGTLNIKLSSIEADSGFCRIHPGAVAGKYCSIQIKDEGVGMDKKTMENIFTPFFSTKKEKGTGLGLSMVYNIIKNHNGFIDVESRLGKGTTFNIYLPGAQKA